MKNNDRQIPEFSNYTIDVLTHEVRNSKGRLIRACYDKRNRSNVKITSDEGKRKTVVIKDLIRKMGVTTGILPPKASIEHQIVTRYYDKIDENTRKLSILSWSELLHKELPGLTIVAIARS